MAWDKRPVDPRQVERLKSRYGLDALTASIFVRRGLTQGHDLLYYMEDDLRFQHSPFSFAAMEDAVDRILAAQEEKEKVLIFGDRDVDGVSATTVLYDCLAGMGLDVRYRLPSGDDAYGLSMAAVDEFAADYGTLIITVDCGISNNAEIARAGELGLDVIVLDHHNPPAALPAPAIIIDPKLEGSGYPFPDISGCAVVYKVVSALRFSASEWYKQEVALLDAREADGGRLIVDCIRLRNLVPVSRITEEVPPEGASIADTRLPSYLGGQLILAWDAAAVCRRLAAAFGAGTEFNVMDLRPLAARLIPRMAEMPLKEVMALSKLAKYGSHAPTEIGGFYNIYVTYVQQALKAAHPDFARQEERDLQLVALAALADIMPMRNENRLFVKNALSSINKGRIRPGLLELMARVDLLGRRVTSTDLSWVVVSHLNAAGRLGHPELAAELFLTQDDRRRDEVAATIVSLNEERKRLSADAQGYAAIQAKASIPGHHGKLCVVIDERINRGVSGILAGRLVAQYDVPAIAVTFVDNGTAIGSMRTCRGVRATAFLDQLGDLFLNHGGHDAAAGFSFTRGRLKEFEARLKELSAGLELSEPRAGAFDIDAEIPHAYLTPALQDVADRLEPFGESSPQPLFMARDLPVRDAMLMGRGERQHLKVIVENDRCRGSGRCKWPCLFWGEGERLNRDFKAGDRVDILFRIERNFFNGMVTHQLVLSDIRRTQR